MDTTSKIRDRIGGLDSEQGILLLFIVISTYMFLRAQAWQYDTRVFPQTMAGLVIIGSLLLIFQNYLPEPIRKVVAGDTSAFQGTEDLEDEIEQEERSEEQTEEQESESGHYDRPLNPVLATALLILLYAGGGYLFSLLVMSPIFAAAYLIWFRQPWYIVVFLSLVALLIAFGFSSLIIVPVDRGILVGDLL